MNTSNTLNTIGLKILELKNQTTPSVKFKTDQWITLSGKEYYSTIESIAFSLSALGAKKLTPVAIMAQTQFKWAATDLASLGLGSLVVSVYPNNTPTDVEFILQHSESSILFIENESLLNSLSEVIHRCKNLHWIVLFSGSTQNEKILSWDSFLEKGQKLQIKNPELFKNSCSSLTIKDPATIIYTSGTTGAPKGVLLSHEQITSEVEEAFSLFGVKSTDISLSFLPYSHILGRVDHWAGIYFKYLVCFAESIEKIKQNLAEIQPTFFISVPRIFEKIYSAISAQLESDQLQKYIFNWAQNVGQKNIDHRLKSKSLSLPLFAQSFLAEKLVFQRVKKFFGGKLRFVVSGGAPLSPSIGNFFLKNGVLILEGYGLTETTAAITVNPPFNYQIGTAGLPIGDVQIKIAEDGEILIKSKKVMLEYYKNPQHTSEVLKNSWFATGDIGHLLPSGHLQITDRKKDLIKTGGGKYVAPQKLENIFKSYPLISYSIIHGDQRKYITALFTLDKENLIKFGQNQNIDFNSWQELIEKRQIFDEVRRIVADVNTQLASYESIKKFKILAIEFSVEGGELTPSLKVKRRALEKKYMNWLDELY